MMFISGICVRRDYVKVGPESRQTRAGRRAGAEGWGEEGGNGRRMVDERPRSGRGGRILAGMLSAERPQPTPRSPDAEGRPGPGPRHRGQGLDGGGRPRRRVQEGPAPAGPPVAGGRTGPGSGSSRTGGQDHAAERRGRPTFAGGGTTG